MILGSIVEVFSKIASMEVRVRLHLFQAPGASRRRPLVSVPNSSLKWHLHTSDHVGRARNTRSVNMTVFSEPAVYGVCVCVRFSYM